MNHSQLCYELKDCTNANENIHGGYGANSEEDSRADDDSRRTTTLEDDYDDQDSFIASENSSTRSCNANGSKSEECKTSNESESESGEDSTCYLFQVTLC